jgi:Protein of unknown function (DUF2924)
MAKRQPTGRAGGDPAPPAPAPSVVETLDSTITGLSDLDADELRLQWRNQLGGIAPTHLPRWLLLRMLAFRMQAATLGDLDKATLRLLRSRQDETVGSRGARSFETRSPTTREGIGLKSGALLVREWKGRLERVMILENGFAWNGETYRSLSQIAKAMTGTSWNGHRFFGLRAAKEPRAKRRMRNAGQARQTDPAVAP